MNSTLVVGTVPCLRGSLLAGVLAAAGLQPNDVDVATASSSEALASVASPSTYAAAFCIQEAPQPSAFLSALLRLLRPGGTCTLLEPGTQATEASSSALLLAGFTGIQAGAAAPAGYAATTAAKPQWEVGAKAAISLKKKPQPAAEAPKPKAWTLDTADDDELLDDADLLSADELRAAPPAAAGDDCEVGKAGRKACKNCTCGRADAEAAGVKVALTQEMLDNPVSACGSCGLGDAFRCASCPYRGLPAFQPGQKITLSADFLASDI